MNTIYENKKVKHNKKVLTMQDISCIGQCSLTSALPILSACGFETVVLPSAVLSTHTGGKFHDYTFHDLTDEIPRILNHWKSLGMKFDCLYTGYLASKSQIDYVVDIKENFLVDHALTIIDPVMGDFGKLYDGFDYEYVAAMRKLCQKADIILPNITEACALVGELATWEIQKKTGKEEIGEIIEKLLAMGVKKVVLKGLEDIPGQIGVAVCNGRNCDIKYYYTTKIERECHGTGDCFASAFTGAMLSGQDILSSVATAAEFVLESIRQTMDDTEHWYGVNFEKALPYLIRKVGEKKII